MNSNTSTTVAITPQMPLALDAAIFCTAYDDGEIQTTFILGSIGLALEHARHHEVLVLQNHETFLAGAK